MKYRKKPIEIDAWQFGSDEWKPDWIYEAERNKKLYFSNTGEFAFIETLEGTMIANLRDYIIKGVEGELYPCKPSVFDITYERVES